MKNKLFRYLFRDMVDFMLLCFFVIVLIKVLIGDWGDMSPYIIAGLLFNILYILGAMWRMGSACDLLNEYVKDDGVRVILGMSVYSLRNIPVKQTLLDMIFRWLVFIGMIVGMVVAMLLS